MIVRLIIGALMIGAVYSVVGIGYSVIYRASGLMSLCQGDMLMFGAFLGLFFNKSLGLPFPIALLFTTVLMFLLGIYEQDRTDPQADRHYGHIYQPCCKGSSG